MPNTSPDTKKMIQALKDKEVLKISPDGQYFTLKSGRNSPLFFNAGDINDGTASLGVCTRFARDIIASNTEPKIIFGPAYKAITLAYGVAMQMSEAGKNVFWTHNRKEEKIRGEATSGELQKELLVGKRLSPGDKIAILDDVVTTGDTKYEAKDLLDTIVPGLDYVGIFVMLDRQEITPDGKNAMAELAKKTGIPAFASFTSSDIFRTLSEIDKQAAERLAGYMRVYGTDDIRAVVGRNPQGRIIPEGKKLVSCEVRDLRQFRNLVKQTSVEETGGFEINPVLALQCGLKELVDTVRQYGDSKVIFNHESAGCDIPEMGLNFARTCKNAGVDGIVLTPLAGPETERGWIYPAIDLGLGVMIEGVIGHRAFIESEYGFVTDDAVARMCRIGARSGVSNFIFPHGKCSCLLAQARQAIEAEGIEPFILRDYPEDGARTNEIVGRGHYAETATRLSAPRPGSTIPLGRSIIPACDVPTLAKFRELVMQTCDVEGIGGYKVGFELAYIEGLKRVVDLAREHTKKPVIYDHQKAGTGDIRFAEPLARVCKAANVDAVIFFPQAGPEAEKAYIRAARGNSLRPIVGGRMTHATYDKSEGGWITNAMEIYRIAAEEGVNEFVVPGNKIEVISEIMRTIRSAGVEPIFYSPGFVAQGGAINDAAKAAGKEWHAIVGRGIYQEAEKPSGMKRAAERYTSQIK